LAGDQFNRRLGHRVHHWDEELQRKIPFRALSNCFPPRHLDSANGAPPTAFVSLVSLSDTLSYAITFRRFWMRDTPMHKDIPDMLKFGAHVFLSSEAGHQDSRDCELDVLVWGIQQIVLRGEICK
jgi:hypothetical protein